ncbi:MAG: delta-aminolevulinic acid dehydratase [Deltaproteobacteria bacterium RIFCSPLOWO2_01_44_7]|nr:MAG: delta-aminolevulinic acid dehydratase [Deltaproteobacteria bacterium RIFCSPHIGHO2_01_FULL_43_49]OGQ15446.1 MAG: delta-aminolevulinic acid dehydratase [Deltaproteobacteria bacterium RIFCSPHIGHO2_02_FULL_44_53]OGQ29639.1 MAG: delta-aminolevulinic acid dehydratase [Deltaproteobacteria bacterium RIFCSPHIGHO2_12_FULL_44_21]OGQ32252.1 MAG: delta-aminolevulinic acid dehydratase [Deltaproteobacteria bacterium RIFCSPLOWO2_01_FULL_45_74]OGQ43895.1 MAG: delta-aminolevulinic acid dehydratase [Delta
MFPQTRLRRLRLTPQIRRLVQETHLNPAQLVWPTFVVEGHNIVEPISSMPGQYRYSVDQLAKEVKKLHEEKIGGILIFGVPTKKDPHASEATKKDSLVAQAIAAVKDAKPDFVVMSDVCLCAYTDHGHCGLVDSKGEIQNDASLEVLVQMALRHAEAGADMIAPSDMLDGRIKVIRKFLDEGGFSMTPIMSYAAKYSSAFYGPFRDAAHSAPNFGDRKSYQLNPTNAKEALREIALDIEEGADIVMVKPALPYLDIIAKAKERFDLPIAAYQVSGEYVMLKEKAAILESLTAIKRAGADIIITYFARQVAEQARQLIHELS